MDPNETLRQLRALVVRMDDEHLSPDELADVAYELATLARALDESLTKGGFLPAAWLPALVTEYRRGYADGKAGVLSDF